MKWQNFLYIIVMAFAGITASYAQETPVISLALMPVQTAFVKGDLDKFRAINWTKDSSQSGVRSLTVDTKLGKDVNVSFEGSGMVGDADYTGQTLVTKEGVGYIKLDYDSLRKYYDNKGGYFPTFTGTSVDGQSLKLLSIDKELALDVGHFAFEIGKDSPDDPSFSFGYERDTKSGSKNRLTWSYVSDITGSSSTEDSRLFSPSYADMDTVTDTLTFKGKAKIAGFMVKGEQKIVLYDGTVQEFNKLRNKSATASAINQDVSRKSEINTKELMTTLRADRWSLNDKSYLAFGYRFAHLHNNTYWKQRLYNPGTLTERTGSTKNADVWANTDQDSNVWTAQILSNFTDNFTVISRFKTEIRSITTEGLRDYQPTASSMAFITDSNVADIMDTAESFSLRYSGLPKTSLYADLDLKQERYKRTLIMATDPLASLKSGSLQIVNTTPEGVGALGMRFSPMKSVTMTNEYKRAVKKNKLNVVQKTFLASNNDDEGYMNTFRTNNDELTSRVSWKPLKWLENSFKVRQISTVYHVQPFEQDASKMPGAERDFIYDVALTPNDQWMFNLAYSLKVLKVSGRGSQYEHMPPTSTSNVYSYMLTTSYAPTQKFSIFNTLEYSRARNRTNADGTALPVGVGTPGATLWGINAAWWNIDTGAKWEPKKDLTIEPHYAYYAYRSYPGIETGNYSAHVVWLDVTKKF